MGAVGAVGAVGAGALAAFLLGAVSPATIVARVLGRDLAGAGSGNPGATNAGRVLGVRWGVLVGLLDVAKGFVPSVLALHLGGHGASYVVGVAAVLGHVWSPFLRGHGGKGAATALGAVLGVLPWFALVMVVVFVAVVALGRWVAGASVAAAVALVVLGVLAGVGRTGPLGGAGWTTTAYGVALAAVVIARHRRNVQGWWRAQRSR